MKPDNWNRFAAGLLAILLCLCSFSMPAFASGSDPAPEPLPEIIEEEPTTGGMEPEGVPITPKGNATLVDDFYGDKQLITVTLAQLARASALHAEGQRFESVILHTKDYRDIRNVSNQKRSLT